MSLIKTIVAGVVLLVVAAASYGYYMQSTHGTPNFNDHTNRLITVGGTPVQAEVVSSDASRGQGLSGRTALAPGSGMLFVFPNARKWGFWMKDMNFDIDIVWADKNGNVVTINKNVSPSTYPQVFYPSASALYVVELPAGFAAAHNLAEGQTIVL